MKVLITHTEKPSKDIKLFYARARDYLKSLNSIEVIEHKDVAKPADYAMVVFVGVDFRIVAETFKCLHKFSPTTQIVFLNPAGDGWQKEFNALALKVVDLNEPSADIFKNIEEFWSLHNFEKYADFKLKQVVDITPEV